MRCGSPFPACRCRCRTATVTDASRGTSSATVTRRSPRMPPPPRIPQHQPRKRGPRLRCGDARHSSGVTPASTCAALQRISQAKASYRIPWRHGQRERLPRMSQAKASYRIPWRHGQRERLPRISQAKASYRDRSSRGSANCPTPLHLTLDPPTRLHPRATLCPALHVRVGSAWQTHAAWHILLASASSSALHACKHTQGSFPEPLKKGKK